ncbi:MAG: hypothetical protein AMXMBFR4_29770 [Candidatus Hydrogenedentota bacterium]
MPDHLASILSRLDALAAYEGPWRPLRDETPLLRRRLAELREREQRLDDLLVIALVGGSGVGKSTLLNALAGDQLAETSEFRPCTATPAVYQPPGSNFGLDGWKRIQGSALEHLVIIDTPDSDTVIRQHRESVIQALTQSDLILICGSPEKYLDEATWSLLRPLAGERTMVCVETKADLETESVREHWTKRLHEQGLAVADYFRVSPRRSLGRKLGDPAAPRDEFDFARLESFLHEELSTERARRIKRSNVSGLLTKTLATLRERVAARAPELSALQRFLDHHDKEVAKEVYTLVGRRIFAEPHLWNFALGRELGLRAKGIVGTLYRLLETLRTLPARIATWMPRIGRDSAGRQAAAMLTEQSLFEQNIDVATAAIREYYANHQSHVTLECAKAGFDPLNTEQGLTEFLDGIQQRLAGLLRGPARDRVVVRARALTSWPVMLLADLPPLAFLGYAGYRIVSDYFAGTILTGNYFLHASAVLAIILALELAAMSASARALAWSARRAATRDLRTVLLAGGIAFSPERTVVAEAARCADTCAQIASESQYGFHSRPEHASFGETRA